VRLFNVAEGEHVVSAVRLADAGEDEETIETDGESPADSGEAGAAPPDMQDGGEGE